MLGMRRSDPEPADAWERTDHDDATRRDQVREPEPEPADRRLGEVEAAPAYIERVLGDRPGDSKRAEAWERAAASIEDYRTAYDIDGSEPTALGPEPAAGAFRQRLHRKLAAGEVLDAQAQLGRPVDAFGPVETRMREVQGLVPDEKVERTRGWEP
jgi:hypothetical protein